MSLSSLLGIARSALQMHQRAIDVAGHNIANASTEGYNRQRLNVTTATPLMHPQGFLGRGVEVSGIERPRDEFLDTSFRRENGALAQFATLRDALGEIENAFGEPSEFALAAQLDAFFSAWSDLANNPLSSAVRSVVQSEGRQLTEFMNGLAGRIDAVQSQTLEQLRADIGDVNSSLKQIADLNRQIAAAGNGGTNAPDLLDKRDGLLDRLSEYLPITVVENNDGSIRVIGCDSLLVDGGATRPLEIASSTSGAVSVKVSDGPSLDLTAGKFAAHVDLINNVIPRVASELDGLAAALVEQVNTLHSSGYSVSGEPAGDFFGRWNVTAATISLATDVAASPDAIAAGTGSGPGDASIALNIAALREARLPSLGNRSIAEYYATMVTGVGSEVREADGFATAQDVLVANIQACRQSVSGVSIDEEMVNLIMHQQAYTAAARLVTVADEMLQEVLRMV